MDGRRWGTTVRVLGALLLLGLFAGVGYSWGLANGGATIPAGVAGDPGTVPVVYAPWRYGAGFGFGFGGIFGILFVIFLVVLLVRVVAGPRRWGGPGGRQGYGPGPGWSGPDDDEAREVPAGYQRMLESWHRRAHQQPSDGAGSPAGGTRPGG